MKSVIIFWVINCIDKFYTLHIISTNSACHEWSKSYLNVNTFYSFPNFKHAFVKFASFEQLNISCGFLVEDRIMILGLKPINKHLLLDSTFDL